MWGNKKGKYPSTLSERLSVNFSSLHHLCIPGLFPHLCDTQHSAISLLQPLRQEKTSRLRLFFPESCLPPPRGIVGSIPALDGQHMSQFVTLTGGFELVDELKQITPFS